MLDHYKIEDKSSAPKPPKDLKYYLLHKIMSMLQINDTYIKLTKIKKVVNLSTSNKYKLTQDEIEKYENDKITIYNTI